MIFAVLSRQVRVNGFALIRRSESNVKQHRPLPGLVPALSAMLFDCGEGALFGPWPLGVSRLGGGQVFDLC